MKFDANKRYHWLVKSHPIWNHFATRGDFFLSGDWGSVTDPESDFSYFARFDVLERYLDERSTPCSLTKISQMSGKKLP